MLVLSWPLGPWLFTVTKVDQPEGICSRYAVSPDGDELRHATPQLCALTFEKTAEAGSYSYLLLVPFP
jgi:hypothetical protein